MNKLMITPHTKVLELITTYPHLEEVLIEMVPAFVQLKNPVLRKTLAKVASLEQAAKVGNTPIDTLVNRLRQEAGQDHVHLDYVPGNQSDNIPAWLIQSNIIQTLDAREMIKNGEHPLGEVIGSVSKMKPGEIYELITPFYPAPLIDKVKEQKCLSWSKQSGENTFNNFFLKNK